jgi:hypothetical protein
MTAQKLEEWLQGYLARCTSERRVLVEAELATASSLREGPSRSDVIEQWQRHETLVLVLGLHDPARAEFNLGPEPFDELRRKALWAKITAASDAWGPPREFDTAQLGSLMAAAFEFLGKPKAQVHELVRAILKTAERPQSG